MELFQLVVVGDAARRQVEQSLEQRKRPPAKADAATAPRRARIWSSSAAALRTLADRLEPSPS